MDYREYYESGSHNRKRTRRLKFKPRFFVFVALLLAIIIVPIALFSRSGEYIVTYGAYDTVGEGYSALIIRDELAYYSDIPGQVSYKVLEGQSVSEGENVLDLFAADYTAQLLADLQDVRSGIKKYQQDSLLSKIVNPELDAFDLQIDECAQKISAFAGGGVNISESELELKALMAQRQDYIKSTMVAQADSELMNMYSNETQLIGRIETWRTAYIAPQSGRVSVYFDGLETVLTANMAELLDIASTQALIRGEKPAVGTLGQPLYRLINPYKWYILFTAPTAEWQSEPGHELLINIDGYSGLSTAATVTRVISDEKRTTSLVVLEASGDIGSLIGERFAYITIGSNTEGLMIPRDAVKQVDGSYGVYLTDEGKTFVRVDILASDPKYYIVMPVIPGELDKGMAIRPR